MDIDIAFICDYAQVAAKIDALGIGFDTIYGTQLPVTHRHFDLVAKIRASSAETGDKDMVVSLIDADGADVIPPITGNMHIPPAPAGVTETNANVLIGFDNVEFPKFSQYSIHVVIQGREMVRIPLKVAEPPPTA